MIGVCQRIRFERLVLRIERLNQLYAIVPNTGMLNLAGECAGCPGDSGNVGGTSTSTVRRLLCAEHRNSMISPLGGAQNAKGFRGDKALVIDGQKALSQSAALE